MIVHRFRDNLPEDNTYVVAHYTGGSWIDSKDKNVWKVVKFRNREPWGQDVDLWFELPRITKGVGYSLDNSGEIQLSQDWMLKDV